MSKIIFHRKMQKQKYFIETSLFSIDQVIMSSTNSQSFANQRLRENPLWTFRATHAGIRILFAYRSYTRKTIEMEKVGRCLHISGTWWHRLASTAANCRPQMICLLHNSIVMREWEQSLLCRGLFSATVSIFSFVYCSGIVCGRVTPCEFMFWPYMNCRYILCPIVDSMTIEFNFFLQHCNWVIKLDFIS